jgi:hypothetical protein
MSLPLQAAEKVDARCPAPKRGAWFPVETRLAASPETGQGPSLQAEELTASLKQSPDTKPEFFRGLLLPQPILHPPGTAGCDSDQGSQ